MEKPTKSNPKLPVLFVVLSTVWPLILVWMMWSQLQRSTEYSRESEERWRETTEQLIDQWRKSRKELVGQVSEQREANSAMATKYYALEFKMRQMNVGRTLVVGRDAVRAPMNTFVLVRNEEGVGAFKFTKEEEYAEIADGRAEYDWYYMPGIAADFSGSKVINGQGVVFPNLLKELPEQDEPVSLDDYSIPGQPLVEFGSINVYWSASRWLYVPEDGKYEFAISSTGNIEDVRIDDPDLIWCAHKPTPQRIVWRNLFARLGDEFSRPALQESLCDFHAQRSRLLTWTAVAGGQALGSFVVQNDGIEP